MYDCSEVRNQLARWNQTSSEWDDKKSKEVERDYIEPLESGINRMAEMLYEVTDFFVTIESKLAELEEKGKLAAVITQNIDGLHQMAGSRKVYELHGSVHRNYCQKCGKFYDAAYVKESRGVPKCQCGGIIKPDVVLYEESLDGSTIRGSIEAISSADTLIIGGTSLVVYPAAGFIDYFHGKHLVVINKSATAKEVGAELSIAAPIGEILGQIRVR